MRDEVFAMIPTLEILDGRNKKGEEVLEDSDAEELVEEEGEGEEDDEDDLEEGEMDAEMIQQILAAKRRGETFPVEDDDEEEDEEEDDEKGIEGRSKHAF